MKVMLIYKIKYLKLSNKIRKVSSRLIYLKKLIINKYWINKEAARYFNKIDNKDNQLIVQRLKQYSILLTLKITIWEEVL